MRVSWRWVKSVARYVVGIKTGSFIWNGKKKAQGAPSPTKVYIKVLLLGFTAI